ncbi:MAG: FAD-binding oxidoreductase, partial [Algiphilus sp.]
MTTKTRNPTGWGYVEDALDARERKALVPMAGALFGGALPDAAPAPPATDIALPRARVAVPASLADTVRDDHAARVLHARGRSFPDLVDLRGERLENAPDAVATPRDEG